MLTAMTRPTPPPTLPARRALPARRVVPVLLALLLVLAACGGAPGSGPAEDELVIYSGRNKELVGPLLEDYAKQTGAKIFVRYGDTAELAAQLLEEGERTEADVFFAQDAGALGALTKAGAFAPLPAALTARVDERFRSADRRWVGVSGRSRVLAYDPETVPEDEVPDSVLDLTDPRWEGEVGFAPTNASFQAFVTGMRQLLGEGRTRQWLEDMKANGMKAYSDNIRVLEAVDRGEVALGLINHYYWYEKVAEEGADQVRARIKFLGNGDPGALVNVAGAGVLATSDQREEALDFVDFLLSEPAQQFFADTTEEYPLIAGVQPDEGVPPLDSIGAPEIDLSDLDSLQATLQLLEEVGLT